MMELVTVCLYNLLDLLASNFLAYYSDWWGFDKDEWNIRPEIRSHRVEQKCWKTILAVLKDRLFAWRQGRNVVRAASLVSP